jgi:hypothetical protein
LCGGGFGFRCLASFFQVFDSHGISKSFEVN